MLESLIFENRQDAGKRLASRLMEYSSSDSVVLALPSGGVKIGYEISKCIEVPLEAFVSTNIKTQSNEVFGAIAEDGTQNIDYMIAEFEHLDNAFIQNQINITQLTNEKKVNRYRKYREILKHSYKNVILVDEGITNGFTINAAIEAIKKILMPKIFTVAIPAASEFEIYKLRQIVDDVIVLIEPEQIKSLTNWYKTLPLVNESNVVNLLHKSHQHVYEF